VVVAIGKLGLVDASYAFKPTCWIVDVGINRGEDGHLHGDCVPALPVAKQTPVPGGVGLLTRLALLENLIGGSK
jgi:methylenetetrahydrofolate dehydrogenase (NADP+)/methenyltetrahydrofolate cyclohydrolase